MTVLIKLIYAGAIAALLVLLIAFGIRTFYVGPEAPEFPKFAPGAFRPVAPVPAGQEQPPPTPEQLEYERAQRDYQVTYERYLDERAGYHSRVFIIAAVLGIVAVAGGLFLRPELDVIRLGLVAGGLGTIIYAVVQAGGDLDQAGAAVVFLVAAAGLGLVLFAGYRWLTKVEA